MLKCRRFERIPICMPLILPQRKPLYSGSGLICRWGSTVVFDKCYDYLNVYFSCRTLFLSHMSIIFNLYLFISVVILIIHYENISLVVFLGYLICLEFARMSFYEVQT